MSLLLLNSPKSNNKLMLDSLNPSNIALGLSLRKINSRYRDSCIRVRRSSDNVETDIGFVGYNLDTVSLLDHCSYTTYINSLTNPDFSTNDTTGWTILNVSGSVSNGILSQTATAQYGGYVQQVSNKQGNKYYAKAYFKADSANVKLSCFGTEVAHSGNNQYQLLSVLGSPSTTGTVSTGVRDFRASSWTQVDVDYVMVVDLTALFGAGLEPTSLAVCDALFAYTNQVSYPSTATTPKTLNLSAYISRWYDQSNNVNHVVQATAANQPRIVNVGILERDFDVSKANALYPTYASANGVNIISNGAFNSNATGWANYGSVVTWNNGVGLCTATNGTTGDFGTYYTVSGTSSVIGKRYFFSAKMRVTNVGAITPTFFRISHNGTGTTTVVNVAYTGLNTWHTVQGIIALPASSSNFKVYAQTLFTGTCNGTELMEVDDFYTVDVTELGQPSVLFTSTGHTTDLLTNTNFVATNLCTINQVIRSNDTGTNYLRSMTMGDATGGTNNLNSAYKASIKQMAIGNRFPEDAQANPTYDLSVQGIVSHTRSATNVHDTWLNGGSNSNKTTNTTTYNTTRIDVGSLRSSSNNTLYWNGYISELIITSALSNAQRSKIEQNQGKYYGITVT